MSEKDHPAFISTETIDLNSVFTRDVMSSPAFDLSGIPATPFGKLLQTLPVPALLVDGACSVVFANQASEKLGIRPGRPRIGSFMSLFADTAAAAEAEAMIKEVFATRKPRVIEAELKRGKRGIWGRVHLRPLRVGRKRSVLAVVEDLTEERQQLSVGNKHLERLQRAKEMLEERLAKRTQAVKQAQERLKKEAAARRSAQEALRQAREELRRLSETRNGETEGE